VSCKRFGTGEVELLKEVDLLGGSSVGVSIEALVLGSGGKRSE
jgi:hypothetical protein